MNPNKCARCGATDTALWLESRDDGEFIACAACLIEEHNINADFVEKKEEIAEWFEDETDEPPPRLVKDGSLYTTDFKQECDFINRLAFRHHRDEVDREFGALLARAWSLFRRWAAPRVWKADLGRTTPIMIYTPFADEKDFIEAQSFASLPLMYGESTQINVGVKLDRLYFDTEFLHYRSIQYRLRIKVDPKSFIESVDHLLE